MWRRINTQSSSSVRSTARACKWRHSPDRQISATPFGTRISVTESHIPFKLFLTSATAISHPTRIRNKAATCSIVIFPSMRSMAGLTTSSAIPHATSVRIFPHRPITGAIFRNKSISRIQMAVFILLEAPSRITHQIFKHINLV